MTKKYLISSALIIAGCLGFGFAGQATTADPGLTKFVNAWSAAYNKGSEAGAPMEQVSADMNSLSSSTEPAVKLKTIDKAITEINTTLTLVKRIQQIELPKLKAVAKKIKNKTVATGAAALTGDVAVVYTALAKVVTGEKTMLTSIQALLRLQVKGTATQAAVTKFSDKIVALTKQIAVDSATLDDAGKKLNTTDVTAFNALAKVTLAGSPCPAGQVHCGMACIAGGSQCCFGGVCGTANLPTTPANHQQANQTPATGGSTKYNGVLTLTVDEHYADTNISYQSHINTTINFSAAFGTTPSDGSVATMVIPDAPFSYTCNRTIYGAGNLSDSLSYSGGLVDHNGSLTAGLDSNYKYFSSPKCLGYTTDPSGLAKKVLENMDKPTFPLTGGTVPISGTYTEGSGTDVFTYSGSFTLTPVQ